MKFKSLAELKAFFNERVILYKTWDPKKTKPVDVIFKEIQDETSRIVVDGKKVIRITVSTVVDVCCFLTDTTTHILEEMEHKFGAGHITERETVHSASKKMRPKDKPADVVKNCLRDKLGFEEPFIFLNRQPAELPLVCARRHLRQSKSLTGSNLIIEVSPYEIKDESPESCPGLPTQRKMFYYLCVIPRSRQILPEFKHRYEGKITRYEWRILTEDRHPALFIR